MRYLKLCMAAGLILAVSGTAQGLTFIFDPNDLMDLYPAGPGPQATQANARLLWDNNVGWSHGTFGTQTDYNSYMNWLDGLGPGSGTHQEGLSRFYVWLLNYQPYSAWGSQVVWNPADTPTATSDSTLPYPDDYWAGKKFYPPSIDFYDFGGGYAGWCIDWQAYETASNIRPGGVDLPEFSFTSKPYWDLTGDGWTADDVPVQEGDTIRVVFTSNSLWFDANGWGNRTPSDGPFVSDHLGGTVWRGTLGENYIIPEPLTVLGVFMGVCGLAGYIRRRSRA